MIDIKLIRENPELIKENQKKSGKEAKLIDEIIEIDNKWRKLRYDADSLRSERNKISKQINDLKKKKKEKEALGLIKEAKIIPEKIKNIEEKTQKIIEKRDQLLKKIPNIISEHTPIGKDDSENVEIKKWGKPLKFSFPIKNHVEIIEEKDLGSFDESAKTSGNGFYYLKGKLAVLNQALIQFAVEFMNKRGYVYVEPPLMIRKEIMESSEGLESIKQSIYEIKDEDLVLIGTAEHALMAMHKEETFQEKDLPKKYFSYSMCFRKEIGAHGINEKGLWRTHQFNKVEQFVFCLPEQSENFYNELLQNSEEILQKLELPYRVIEICTGDLAKWKHRSADLEVWRPTTNSYGEVMSLSNVTDYQARDHNIRVTRKNNEMQVVHTLNNTALATSRILVAILENNQQVDGSISIPEVLWKYTGFKKI
jgi:seryl-tRNA synthetase